MTDNPMTEIEKDKDTKQTQGNKYITVHGDYYEQSGNLGAGHVSESEIKEKVKLGGVINEAEQHPKTTQGETGQERKQEKRVSRFGKLKSEDQKYDGSLVCIGLNFFNYSQPNQQTQQPTGLLLDISFGEVEENYIEQNKLGIGKQERPIRFGIKFGELCLKFTKEPTLFNLLNNPEAEKITGQATSVGTTKSPKWQFKAESKLEAENYAVVLFGSLLNQELGTVNFLNSLCEVEATFKVSGVNSNNLGITAQEGLWDEQTSKRRKETKIRAFFKRVVEPKLKDYVSKVVLQYDSAVVS